MTRILHVMLRVADLERSEAFYVGVLGMRVLRRVDRRDHGYSLAFLGYGSEQSSTIIELTCNHGVGHYELGTAFGHIAIAVPSASAACHHVRERGGTVVREAGPVVGGDEVIAFVVDPDGYRIELIERT